MCLIPLIVIGYSHSIQTSWHHNSPISGEYIEISTCLHGVSGRIAISDQWIQVGPQYGKSWMWQDWVITPSIHGGLGYSNELYQQRRQISYFNAGIGLSAQYNKFVIRGGYDHMSNGQFGHPSNHGQDLVLVGGGYEF